MTDAPARPRDAKGRFLRGPDRLPRASWSIFADDDRRYVTGAIDHITAVANRIEASHQLHLTELRTWRKVRTGKERTLDFLAGIIVTTSVVFVAYVWALG